MDKPGEALQQKLLAAFQSEAGERIRVLADGLAMLEQGSGDAELIESLYREVHSLKGAARAVGYGPIEQLCQAWESLFAALRSGKLEPGAVHAQLGREASALIERMLQRPPAQVEVPAPLADLCHRLQQAATGQVSPPEQAREAREDRDERPTQAQAWIPLKEESALLRVDAARFDNLLIQADTLQQTRLEASQALQELTELATGAGQWRHRSQGAAQAARRWRTQGNRAPLSAEQQAMLEFFDWVRNYLGGWEYRFERTVQTAQSTERSIRAVSDGVQQELQAILILPCSVLAEGLPALVQNIADDAGKQVALHITGSTLNVDKRVLDGMRSPLQHLLRNAVDHGIETAEARRARGKAAQGRITVEFVQESGGHFELRVEDDGAGLDPQRLREKALAMELIDEEAAAAMSDDEACQLAFHSGLSTSALITDLSGRGLGLAIVREKVERLGGELRLSSERGRGTRFTFRLPISLATYRALLLQVAERTFALSAMAVERVVRLPQEELKSIENRLTMRLGEQVVPLWRLHELLALTPPATPRNRYPVVVLRTGQERFGLLVDAVLGDEEVVIKPLGPQLQRVRNILGATLLGDGRVVPILHVQDLYKSALMRTSAPIEVDEGGDRRKRILVAEDSITSRSLLKMILEGAGYEVATVNDGVEAWDRLRESEFELLVSDIEMPRMDGFELTARLRADRRLGELPVILVTALSSARDRERGLEAGANAYIVKSGFDQANLLDVIRQLV